MRGFRDRGRGAGDGFVMQGNEAKPIYIKFMQVIFGSLYNYV